ncbi:MAG: glycoside hydrolase family 2 protein, partial [Actinomycetota bacterium]|nr:glycoside hydrolase family 2 protein [Actinomycetota bacterium]
MIGGEPTTQLTGGWELAGTEPGALSAPPLPTELDWIPAEVPGTVAAALGAAGLPVERLDERDWWFRTRFTTEPVGEGEQLVLRLGGLATVAEAYLDGEPLLRSDSMFAAHEVDVSDLCGRSESAHELLICARALAPLLAQRRRPRARWRTRLVSSGNLRFFRTMLLGRSPGFAPGPAVVGPWRPVSLDRRRLACVAELALRARVQGGDGVVQVRGRLRALHPARPVRAASLVLAAAGREHRGVLELSETGELSGELRVADPRRWWPHTHGEPALYDATLRLEIAGESLALPAGRVGFRTLQGAEELEQRGLDLRINGVPVFARGAVWTPLSLERPHAPRDALRAVLQRVRDAGMNMLRVPGIACYESEDFYDLCDELGILVWQDFMFANLDYPEADREFMKVVEAEVRGVMAELGHRPSLSVLCGGSEVAQQVAMLGLDPALASGPLYGELLPQVVAQAEVDAPYVPSAPWGGELPFRPDRGIANYYGVGAYRRELEDARRAEVKFAAECLAFANVPDEAALQALGVPGNLVTHHPAWKAGVPRDVGAGWDFEDVRDHYLRRLFDVDPAALRWSDHDRYLELSRAVTGEVMAEVFGEWRRPQSGCGGGLVLWLTDQRPGAGWGILDHRGEPKVALHHLSRVLAPVAVWSTDEGLGGIVAQVANDRATHLRATLRVALYRDLEQCVEEASQKVELEPHCACSLNLETVLGRFVDVGWAYRFGPPGQDLVVLSLERAGEPPEVLGQAFRLPVGRPTGR